MYEQGTLFISRTIGKLSRSLIPHFPCQFLSSIQNQILVHRTSNMALPGSQFTYLHAIFCFMIWTPFWQSLLSSNVKFSLVKLRKVVFGSSIDINFIYNIIRIRFNLMNHSIWASSKWHGCYSSSFYFYHLHLVFSVPVKYLFIL